MSTGSVVDFTGGAIDVHVTPTTGYIPTGTTFLVASGNGNAVTPVASNVTAQAVGAGNTAFYTFQYERGDIAALGLSAHDVYLVATRQALSTLGSAITANGTSVGNALAAIGGTGDASLDTVQGVVGAAPTAAAVNNDLQSLTPTVDGGAQVTALDIGAETQDLASNRMTALRNDDTASGVAAGGAAHGASVWGEAYAQHARQDARDNVNGYSANTGGGVAGFDTSKLMNNVILGVAVNYGQSTINSSNANTTETDLNSYGLNFYGTYDLGRRMFVDGQAGYAYNTVDTHRHNANLAGATANGSTHSDQ